VSQGEESAAQLLLGLCQAQCPGPFGQTAEQLDALIEKIDMALSASPDSWPNNRFQVLDGEQKQLLKELQAKLAGAAEQLGIAPGMLYSRKQLEKLIFSQAPAKLLDSNNWRYDEIGEQLLQLIENR